MSDDKRDLAMKAKRKPAASKATGGKVPTGDWSAPVPTATKAAMARKPFPAKAARPAAATSPAALATATVPAATVPVKSPVAKAPAAKAPAPTPPAAVSKPTPPAPVVAAAVPKAAAPAAIPAAPAPAARAPIAAASPAAPTRSQDNVPSPAPLLATAETGTKYGVTMMNDTMEKMKEATQAGQVKAQEVMQDMGAQAKAAAEKSMQMVSEANEFGKGNIEAVVECQKIAVKGAQEIGRDNLEFAKAKFDDSARAMKDLAAVKSPTEYLEIQGDLARRNFDDMIQQVSKNTEAMLKLYGDAFQPLSTRMSVAVEKMKVAA